jgi:hypothetical protein
MKMNRLGYSKAEDWSRAIQRCIENPGETKDKKVRRHALKYTILDGELYRRTMDGLLSLQWEKYTKACAILTSRHTR